MASYGAIYEKENITFCDNAVNKVRAWTKCVCYDSISFDFGCKYNALVCRRTGICWMFKFRLCKIISRHKITFDY